MDSIDVANINKTIYLIRHGQTDFNKNGIIQGSGINSSLNAEGQQQALKFWNHYQSIDFDHIYTSCLNRTIQTVEQFIKSKPHTALSYFDEINWGIMEGAIQTAERTVEYQKIVSKWSSGILDIAIENGETPLEMYERQIKGLQHLMNKTNEKKVLICMHGRAMRSFLCLLTQTHLSEMEKWEHSNVCLYVLKYNGQYFDVEISNCINHLK